MLADNSPQQGGLCEAINQPQQRFLAYGLQQYTVYRVISLECQEPAAPRPPDEQKGSAYYCNGSRRASISASILIFVKALLCLIRLSVRKRKFCN